MQPNETIVEIGPGHGALTISLAEAAQKIGAKIIAIEKDTALAEILKSRIPEGGDATIEIVIGDALDILTERQHEMRADKIIGNIPYYITGHLLRVIGELKNKPRLSILMLQKEVAERICATPPKMNRLAASVQYWAEPKIIASLSKTEFSPPPEVDSAVLKLETRQLPSEDMEQYYATVRTLFAQPRKTILNNLAAAEDGKRDKNKLIEALNSLGISPTDRPQNLTIENIRAIAENIDP